MIEQVLPLNRDDIVEAIRSSLPAISLDLDQDSEEDDQELELQDDDVVDDIEESDEESTVDQTTIQQGKSTRVLPCRLYS